jgi:hypothetical protein
MWLMNKLEGSHGIAALPPCTQNQLKVVPLRLTVFLIARPFRRPLAVTAALPAVAEGFLSPRKSDSR